MTAPDAATEAAATAIYVNYSEVRSSWTDWTEITDEARDYFRQLATAALDAARPHAEAEATARERQRIRQLAIDNDAQVMLHDDPTNPAHWCTRPFADLLDGGGT